MNRSERGPSEDLRAGRLLAREERTEQRAGARFEERRRNCPEALGEDVDDAGAESLDRIEEPHYSAAAALRRAYAIC